MITDLGAADGAADGLARLTLVAVAGVIGIAAALLFVGWPDIDLGVSRLLYVGPRQFVLTGSWLGDALRLGFRLLTWGAALLAACGIVMALAKGRRLLDRRLADWVLLGLVLITGPGIVANSVLKDHWGRPRPLYVIEFGGPYKFTPALNRSGQCDRNCSFVSGEASATFVLGFAIAMLTRQRRKTLMGAALAAGAVSGLIRIAEGGHFLSDVVFAGVFMALDVALIHWLVFGLSVPRAQSEAWWHARTLALAAAARQRTEIAFAASSAWFRRHSRPTLAKLFAGKKGPDDPRG
jgi:lipid A 4'-phosphatase